MQPASGHPPETRRPHRYTPPQLVVPIDSQSFESRFPLRHDVLYQATAILALPVLTNGIEVKLQRNALSVIEAPTGNEEDGDLEFESGNWNTSDLGSDSTQKSHRSRHRVHKSYSSSHKPISRSFSSDSQSKDSISKPRGSMKVDLSKLEMAALWRYWRHFKLIDDIPNPSREQLIDGVQRHFMSQQMDEMEVIAGFVQAAKRLKTVRK